jgi:hypothetical protein
MSPFNMIAVASRSFFQFKAAAAGASPRGGPYGLDLRSSGVARQRPGVFLWPLLLQPVQPLARILLAFACCLPCANRAQAAEFPIAPDGADTNSGSREQPFATLERARRFMLEGDVDVTSEPYALRYPDFLRTHRGVAIAADCGTTLSNRIFNDAVVAGGAGISAGRYPEQGIRHHNVEFDSDPGFVDEAAGDYSLRADAAIFEALPGFEPIPFGKMGRITRAHDAAPPPRRSEP